MEIRNYADVAIYGSLLLSTEVTDFPANPRPGEIINKDGRHYAYTKLASNYYSWLPIAVKQSAYVHVQGVAATTWTIPHNLGTADYGLFVYDSNHNLVMVNHKPTTGDEQNSVTVSLASATSGTAVVFAVTDFSATNFSTSTLKVGTLTLTDSSGSLAVNGTALGGSAVTSVNGQTGAVTITSPVTSVNGQTGAVTVSVPVTSVNGQTGAVAISIPYDVASYTSGKPAASEKVVALKVVTAFSLAANLAGSAFVASTAATASTVFSVKKNGTQFTTITVAASGTSGTIASCAQTSFAVGDVLTVEAPATADATLADIMIALKGVAA